MKPFSVGLEQVATCTLPSSMRSCGRFGPASDGVDGRRGRASSDLRVVDLARASACRTALRLEVGLERVDLSRRCGRCRGSSRWSSRRPGRSPSSRRIRAPCCRSSRGRARDSDAVPSPKNSTNLPTTFSLRSISVTVSTRSVAVHAFAQRARQSTPTTSGRQEVDRLAQHAGLGLDAAHAPADDADAVDHRRVAVGADQRVGVVDAVLARCTPRARYSRLTWCTMPMPGGTTPEGVERLHAPLHELVALAVALELELHVQVERVRARRSSRPCTEWSTTRSTGTSGSIIFGFLPRRCGDAAHRGEVGQQRHAGEVLQHDARDDERNLVGARARSALQLASCAHVLLGDLLAVAVAQHATPARCGSTPAGASMFGKLLRRAPAASRSWPCRPAGLEAS